MSVLSIESFEGVIVVPVPLFQFRPVLEHVDVLQTIIIGIDIILIGTVTDIEHTFVSAVDVDDDRSP